MYFWSFWRKKREKKKKGFVYLIFLEKKEREKKKRLCISDLSDVKAHSGKRKKSHVFLIFLAWKLILVKKERRKVTYFLFFWRRKKSCTSDLSSMKVLSGEKRSIYISLRIIRNIVKTALPTTCWGTLFVCVCVCVFLSGNIPQISVSTVKGVVKAGP